MKVRVLGCYGSLFTTEEEGRCAHYHSSCFQVNESVLIDAGGANGPLNLAAMAKIRYVFLSHAHLDHTHSLPFMAENLFGKIVQPIVIVSTEPVLSTLQRCLFNDQIWPDFTKIPNPENPTLRYEPIEVGRPMVREGLTVTAVAVNHTVPAVGFLVESGSSAFVYSGDTYQTEEIWDRASRLPSLTTAFIEMTFPNRFGALAEASKHLTPELTYREFLKIQKKEIVLHPYHMKYPYLDELRKELSQIEDPRIHPLQDGQVLTF
jgi:ribonuclease BN (tRNA processing enzyme)